MAKLNTEQNVTHYPATSLLAPTGVIRSMIERMPVMQKREQSSNITPVILAARNATESSQRPIASWRKANI